MGKKLYVGNLPFSATEAELMEMFSEYGAVDSVRLIVDRQTGRSKGFGFVEMASDEAAEESISKIGGRSLEGRQILVNEARPQETKRIGNRTHGQFPSRRGFGDGNRGHYP